MAQVNPVFSYGQMIVSAGSARRTLAFGAFSLAFTETILGLTGG